MNPAMCYEAAPAGWHPVYGPMGYDAVTEWGCNGVNIPGASDMGIGAGKQNTAAMLAAGCTTPNTSGQLVVAVAATDYRGGGKDDWYLPSGYELNEMYKYQGTIGGFATGNYWASNEVDSQATGYAWVWFFMSGAGDGGSAPTGMYGYNIKRATSYVRPIRSFQ